MTVGHLAAGLGAAGSITLNWQQQGTYVDKLPRAGVGRHRRWSDNKKNKQPTEVVRKSTKLALYRQECPRITIQLTRNL